MRLSKGLSLCILPVRGGSKRVPKKNMQPFCGKPLLQWGLEAARGAGCFDRILLTSDDDELLEVACSIPGVIGVKQPHIPDWQGSIPALCGAVRAMSSSTFGSDTPINDAWHNPPISEEWQEYLSEMQRLNEFTSWDGQTLHGEDVASVCYIRATSPLVRGEDILQAMSMFQGCGMDIDSVVSVMETTGAHPSRFKSIDQSGMLVDKYPAFQEGAAPQMSSSLVAYVRNSQVAVIRPHVIDAGGMYGTRIKAFEMSEERSVDINTWTEFKAAEAIKRYLDGEEPD